MSFNRQVFRKIAIAAAAAAVLAACGYTPIYGPRSTSQTASELSSVRVGFIENRTGQILRNHLLDRINPKGQPDNPQYHLTVTIAESVRNLGIQSDETSTRSDLTITANYALVQLGINEPVFKGVSRSTNSFNRVRSHYATVVAARDARERAAIQIANEISNRLGAYIKRTQGQ